MNSIRHLLICTLCFLGVFTTSCDSKKNSVIYEFDGINNRIWIGEDFWAVPMEDWRVENGRIECIADRGNSRVNLLTQMLNGEGDVEISAKVGKLNPDKNLGSVGFTLGLQDETDNDVRSLCYFGKGTQVGINLNGEIYIGETVAELPNNFNFDEVLLVVKGNSTVNQSELSLTATDKNGLTGTISEIQDKALKGIFTLVNNHPGRVKGKNKTNFWFDDLSVSGTMVEHKPENSFGPMLWSMYTLSRKQLKLTVQMPPIGVNDEQKVEFQLKEDKNWQTKAKAQMDVNARTATFTLDNWDDTKAQNYRLVYNQKFTDGTYTEHAREGIIQRDPVDKPMEMGAMTCQYHYGFPYRPLTKQLEEKNPDILFFSGDQIYEVNGGYGIIRFPADRAILSYLGKWYMFGWAFGDLMKDRPTICIADDHEVFQGNLWGAGGKKVSVADWNNSRDSRSGFVEPVEMVNVVIRTNTSHQPAPFDPTPIEQGMEVYYTDVVYGRVSFALVTDRTFKSGPEEVASVTQNAGFWNGRKDMLFGKYPSSYAEKESSLKLLGDRQIKFLNHWATDWEDIDMKVLLSQTIFANNVTHYGPKKIVLGSDLDSGGWPKAGRDKALKILQKCQAFQICGDQHLPSMVQYGIKKYKDANWVFCTPAIAVGYQRRFMPDTLNIPVSGRPKHNAPNTGLYTDGLGNKNFVYAIGNPDNDFEHPNRYQKAQNCASGFGYVTFDQENRKITSNSFRFLPKEDDQKKRGEFYGWPKTIDLLDHYQEQNSFSLPVLHIQGAKEVLVEIRNNSDELVNVVRPKDSIFVPRVDEPGSYNIRITDAKGMIKELKDLSTRKSDLTVVVNF